MSHEARSCDYEATILAYYAACDARDAERIAAFFTADAAHYFPAGDTFPDGTAQTAFVGADAIGRGFSDGFQGSGRAYWKLDRLLVDVARREAVIEWSNFKPGLGAEVRLRGAEWYVFDEAGLIKEIRAYYACPPASSSGVHELGGFDYAGRGYSTDATWTEAARGSGRRDRGSRHGR
jgi:hypothetical protein